MMKSITLTASILGALAGGIRAQDIHFTLYDMIPLAFNPAESGAFHGTYRLAAIYRDQWLSVTGVPNEYKTPALSIDVPVIKGFRDNDWVGVGVLLYSDRSGSLNFQNNAVKISAAYHYALDRRGETILSLGYQTGGVQRRIKDVDKIELLVPDPNLLTQDLKASYTDHAGGLHFKSALPSGDLVQFGVSVANIGRPRLSLGAGGIGINRLPMRFLGHGSYRTLIAPRVALHPSVFFQSLGPSNEFMVQAVAEYLFNPEKDVVLKGGAGIRTGDALQIILGVNMKDLQVLFGYDVNISRLSPASNTFGGFEISASFIGRIYKRPDPDPVLFCPRF